LRVAGPGFGPTTLFGCPMLSGLLARMGREKLLVEIKAEELIVEVKRLLGKITYCCKAAKDLENSADSTYLNLGEGVAAFRPRKKAMKYDIARGEAKEVQRALRALVLKGKLTEEDIKVANDLADHIVAMLTNMIKGLEARF
jgi:four helix bundle protein